MDEHRPYSRDLALQPLPKRHAYFERWEFDTRAKIMAACGGGEFQAEHLFANIDKDQNRPWDYSPNGSAESMAKRQAGYRRINVQLWAALLAVMKQAIKGENDGSASLQWKLFHDEVVKATARIVDVAVRPAEPWLDANGVPIEVAPVWRALMPEFNGQWLWCKMRRHVIDTSQPAKHRVMKEFHQIKIQGGHGILSRSYPLHYPNIFSEPGSDSAFLLFPGAENLGSIHFAQHFPLPPPVDLDLLLIHAKARQKRAEACQSTPWRALARLGALWHAFAHTVANHWIWARIGVDLQFFLAHRPWIWIDPHGGGVSVENWFRT